MTELKLDPISKYTVVIAPERSKRPKDDFSNSNENSKLCPFCPGNEDQTPPENYSNGDNIKSWTIRSFPNKYPAFRSLNSNDISGIQDVIVESDKHDINMGDFSKDHFRELLRVFKWRFEAIKKNSAVKYILIFKNHGQMAGASLVHPHSQIVGLSFVPSQVEKQLRRLGDFYTENKKCYYCDLIDNSEVVFKNKSFISVSPSEARFSYESWILPFDHQVHYEEITDNQLNDLSEIFSRQIKTMNIMLDNPAFNVVFNSGPYNQKNTKSYHWNIQIIPRISYLAGFECATGMFINQVEPENAAQEYKKNAL